MNLRTVTNRRSLSESKPKATSVRRSCMTGLPKRKRSAVFEWQSSTLSNYTPAMSNVSVVAKSTPNFSTSVRKSLFMKNLNESLKKSGRKSQGNMSSELLEEMNELFKEGLKKTPLTRRLKRLRDSSGSSGSVVKRLKKRKYNEDVFKYIILCVLILMLFISALSTYIYL